MDKSADAGAVDNPGALPTPEEIAQLIGERLGPPRVMAYELAKRLGCDPSSLSLFETGRRALPHGMGVKAYRKALDDLKRQKRAAVA